MTTAISPLPQHQAGWFVRLFYWVCRRKIGSVPAPVGIKAHHKRVLIAYGLFEYAMEKASALTPRVKALANLKAAMEVGCRFCVDIGSAYAKEAGLTQEELLSLVGYEDEERWTDLERDVLELTVSMTGLPTQIDPLLMNRLRDQVGEKGLVELVSTIAWENYRARFNHAFGAVEEGFSEQVCIVPPLEHA